MEKFLIVSPTVFEAAPVFAALGYKGKPELGAAATRGNVSALASGVGCAAATERVRGKIDELRPTHVILAGFCGACRTDMKNGDFIFKTDDDTLKTLARKFGGREAEIATVGRIADTKRKLELGDSGFAGVDMEGTLFENAAKERGIKFSHLRWVSDSLESDIPPSFFQSTMNMETGGLEISILRTAAALAKSPKLLIKLVKFGREIAPAKRRYESDIKSLVGALRAS